MFKYKFNNSKNQSGFTLLEVLAALAVISIALVALFASLAQGTRLASRVEERMIGNWVASNAMTQLQATSNWPSVGDSTSDATMAGRTWYIQQQINATEDENVRRVEVFVSIDNKGSYTVANLFGYFLNPKPKLVEDESQFSN